MAIGYFIGQGDKTSCGGMVLEGESGMMFGDIARAVEGHAVTCGEDDETYAIVGGLDSFVIEGRRAAGSLHSVSSCPCKAALIPSYMFATYVDAPAAPARSSSSVHGFGSPATAREAASSRVSGFVPYGPAVTLPRVGAEPAEPGFYLVPKSISRSQLQSSLFPSSTAQVLSKFHSLNPGPDLVKAGTLIVLSDPNNLQCTREEAMLMNAAANANDVLSNMSAQEADFMMRHRDEIATFLGHGSTAIGVGQVMFAQHLQSIKRLLERIDELHRRTFQTHGHLRAAEFFTERKQLFDQLDAHLNSLMRKGVGLSDHPKLKSALGISSRSLVHHWSQSGTTSRSPGHTAQINALARAAKVVSAGGWIGTIVGGGASYLKVQEVCSAGDAKACERVKFTEVGSFSGSIAGGGFGASAGIALGGVVCVAIGVGTLGIGGIACGLVVTGASSLAGGLIGEKVGESIGEIVYERTK